MANIIKLLIPVLLAGAAAMAEPTQAWIAAHPAAAAALAGVASILSIFVKSPRQ